MTTEEEKGVGVICVVLHLLVQNERAENYLENGAFARVLAQGCHALVGAPHSTSAFHITSDHAAAISGEGDVGDWTVVDCLVVSCETLVLIPKSHKAVFPANSKRLHEWVPFELADSASFPCDLEVGHNGALLCNEYDAGCTGGHSQHHVKLVVAPGAQEGLLAVHKHVVVKEHRHLPSRVRSKFKLLIFLTN